MSQLPSTNTVKTNFHFIHEIRDRKIYQFHTKKRGYSIFFKNPIKDGGFFFKMKT